MPSDLFAALVEKNPQKTTIAEESIALLALFFSFLFDLTPPTT